MSIQNGAMPHHLLEEMHEARKRAQHANSYNEHQYFMERADQIEKHLRDYTHKMCPPSSMMRDPHDIDAMRYALGLAAQAGNAAPEKKVSANPLLLLC